VLRKRQNGDYPVGLERQLEAEFRAILEITHRGTHDLAKMQSSLSELHMLIPKLQVVGDASSKMPGGSIVHRVFRRLLRRHTTAMAEDLKQIFARIDSVLTEMSRAVEAQRRHDERLLNDVLGGVLDRLAVIDSLALVVPQLERRLLAQTTDAN
jgi:hypothetical protein